MSRFVFLTILAAFCCKTRYHRPAPTPKRRVGGRYGGSGSSAYGSLPNWTDVMLRARLPFSSQLSHGSCAVSGWEHQMSSVRCRCCLWVGAAPPPLLSHGFIRNPAVQRMRLSRAVAAAFTLHKPPKSSIRPVWARLRYGHTTTLRIRHSTAKQRKSHLVPPNGHAGATAFRVCDVPASPSPRAYGRLEPRGMHPGCHPPSPGSCSQREVCWKLLPNDRPA